jgi:hypothetical protein
MTTPSRSRSLVTAILSVSSRIRCPVARTRCHSGAIGDRLAWFFSPSLVPTTLSTRATNPSSRSTDLSTRPTNPSGLPTDRQDSSDTGRSDSMVEWPGRTPGDAIPPICRSLRRLGRHDRRTRRHVRPTRRHDRRTRRHCRRTGRTDPAPGHLDPPLRCTNYFCRAGRTCLFPHTRVR